MAWEMKATSGSLDDILKSLAGETVLINEAVAEGTRQMAIQAKEDLQRSYLATVPSAKVNDYVYSGIDYYYYTPATNSNKDQAWMSVGVFNETAQFGDIKSLWGKSKGAMNPAQIAYWLEHGTNRLNSGARKPKNISWDQLPDSAYGVAIPPKPFISRSATSDSRTQDAAFAQGFNKITESRK